MARLSCSRAAICALATVLCSLVLGVSLSVSVHAKAADRGGDRMLEIVKRDIERWVAVVKKGGANAVEADKK